MQEDLYTSPIKTFFRNKWIQIILCLNVVIIFIIIGLFVHNNTKTAILTFNITPVDATISINGNDSYLTDATYRLSPGTYSVTISHSGLSPKTFNLNLPGDSSTLLSTFLSAANGSDFSFYELRENHDSALKLLSIASADNNQTYDHDSSAEQFVSEYQTALDTYDSSLPISETSRENPDDGGRLTSIITIQRDDSCTKYLCVLVSFAGVSDATKTSTTLLENAGFNMKYLDIKYATN